MKKQIFRKEAMDRMASPEQLDELMPVTSPRGWMALAGIGAVLLLAILWGIFGKIETSAVGAGVLVREGGMQHIMAPADGEVLELSVKAGQSVESGQTLGRYLIKRTGDESLVQEIVADRAGRVLFVASLAGDKMQLGEPLLGIELPEAPMQAVLYVSTKVGYQVEPEQLAQLTLTTADRYSSQVMFGRVKTAGRFPESGDSILRTVQNPESANQLSRGGPVLEVIVELTQRQELEHLFYGTPCSAKIIVSRKRPIDFVFPVFSRQ